MKKNPILWKADRFPELDLWRGLAVIGMAVFHTGFLLDYLGILQVSFQAGGLNILAHFVRWSFLLLVGIGIQISYQKTAVNRNAYSDFLLKNIKRALVILWGALFVTLGSFMIVPDEYIVFGVLHFIGVSILILGFFAPVPWAAIPVALFAYLASFVTNAITINIPWLVILGFQVPGFRSLDYFSIFPWLAVPALGMLLGSLLFLEGERRYSCPKIFQFSALAPIRFLGKQALIIYLIHVPIILLFLKILFDA